MFFPRMIDSFIRVCVLADLHSAYFFFLLVFISFFLKAAIKSVNNLRMLRSSLIFVLQPTALLF